MGLRLLLDTHALHWAAVAPEKLSDVAREALANADNELTVSVVSAWELRVGARKKRLDLGPDPTGFVRDLLRPFPPPHPVDLAVAVQSESLDGYDNPDPADRFLLATALVHRLAIVTADRSIRAFAGVTAIW